MLNCLGKVSLQLVCATQIQNGYLCGICYDASCLPLIESSSPWGRDRMDWIAEAVPLWFADCCSLVLLSLLLYSQYCCKLEVGAKSLARNKLNASGWETLQTVWYSGAWYWKPSPGSRLLSFLCGPTVRCLHVYQSHNHSSLAGFLCAASHASTPLLWMEISQLSSKVTRFAAFCTALRGTCETQPLLF